MGIEMADWSANGIALGWGRSDGRLISVDEARLATGRSRDLAPLSRAFFPYWLEVKTNSGGRCPSLSSPDKDQGLRRQSREDSDCGSGQFDNRGRGVGIHQSIGTGASGTRFVRNSS